MRILDQRLARNVDHREFECVPQFFLKLIIGTAIGQHRLIDRRFSRQYRELLIGFDHGAFDEQAVNPARIFDCIDQAASGLQIKRQRVRTKMNVKIEQCRQTILFGTGKPGN